MRRLVHVFTALLAFALALPALAGTEDVREHEEFERGQWITELTSGNRALAGLNGLITWPADPVMMVVHVSEAFEDVPLAAVTGRFLGLGGGLLLGVHRLTMGVLDIVFQPVPYMPMLSPVPRYKAIPWFEHDDE